MKTLELHNMGLTPITKSQTTEITGGFLWIPAALLTGLVMSAINNFGDIREGFTDGWNGKSRYKS